MARINSNSRSPPSNIFISYNIQLSKLRVKAYLPSSWGPCLYWVGGCCNGTWLLFCYSYDCQYLIVCLDDKHAQF